MRLWNWITTALLHHLDLWYEWSLARFSYALSSVSKHCTSSIVCFLVECTYISGLNVSGFPVVYISLMRQCVCVCPHNTNAASDVNSCNKMSDSVISLIASHTRSTFSPWTAGIISVCLQLHMLDFGSSASLRITRREKLSSLAMAVSNCSNFFRRDCDYLRSHFALIFVAANISACKNYRMKNRAEPTSETSCKYSYSI